MNGINNFINAVVTYPSIKETRQNTIKTISAKTKKVLTVFLSLSFFFRAKHEEYVQNKTNTGIKIRVDKSDDSGTKSPLAP